jgi:hypothetical protein
MRLAARSVPRFDRPVMLPPGRASEATRPLPIGSSAVVKTIGMLDVACFAAIAASVPAPTMTSDLSGQTRPRSRHSARRVPRPNGDSIATVWPSIQPSSPSRRTNASTRARWLAAVPPPNQPITGMAGCCARARLTLTASSRPPVPSSAMNSRRFMSSMGTFSPMPISARPPEGIAEAEVRGLLHKHGFSVANLSSRLTEAAASNSNTGW